MRKVTERQAGVGVTPTKKNERLYLGDWEVYRSFQSDGVTVEMERESLSVMEEQQRIALVDTKTVDAGTVLASPLSVWRLQLGDHLGSACLEVTEDVGAGVLTYEEYHPFGTSSYRANNSAIDVSEKRYRYTGKERDEENGFGYHGARYYAPWLGRWTAADPAGIIDGANLYAYVRNQPTMYLDSSGKKSQKPRVFVIGIGHDKDSFFLAAERFVKELKAKGILRKGDQIVLFSQKELRRKKLEDVEKAKNSRERWVKELSKDYQVTSILQKTGDMLPVAHLRNLTIDVFAVFSHGSPRHKPRWGEKDPNQTPSGGSWVTEETYLDSSQSLFSQLKFSSGATLGFFACSLSGFLSDAYAGYYAKSLSKKLSAVLVFSFKSKAFFGYTRGSFGRRGKRMDVLRTRRQGRFYLWKKGQLTNLTAGVDMGIEKPKNYVHQKGALSVFVSYIDSFFKKRGK